MTFDPYFKWLGIPPDEQPPNYYRLLAIPPFIDDDEVIENAADRLMSHVRTFAIGKHSSVSQQILNEISRARISLLNPTKKATYDSQLRAELESEETIASKPIRRTGQSVSLPQFMELLERSQLLNAQQMAAARKVDSRDPAALAKKLIVHQILTTWQAQQLLTGRSAFFLGKYKLLEKLGEGGMGAVYKAEQQPIQRLVAIKVMHEKVLQEADAVARFKREVRTVAALDHPNIIRALDADQVGEKHFLVMEYARGRDLKAYIQEFGRLPVDWSCECICQAALGLQHAHEQHLVHRDIKPGNILVLDGEETEHPKVKILDLGLARFTSEAQCTMLTQTGQVLGTIDYISPEQATDTKNADIRSDIFSLGCTLFKLVTGEVPFAGDSPVERLMARARHEAPRASSLRGDVPPAVDNVIDRMLRNSPDERYQTPMEVADALQLARSGQWDELSSSMRLPTATATSDSTIEAVEDATLNEFLGNLEVAQVEPVRANPEPAPPPNPLTSTDSDEAQNTFPPTPWIWAGSGIGVFLVALLLLAFVLPGSEPEVVERDDGQTTKSLPEPRPAKKDSRTPVRRPVDRPQPRPADRPQTPPLQPGEAVDLLSVTVREYKTGGRTPFMHGNCVINNGALQITGQGIIQLPYEPTESYRLRLHFTQTQDTGSVRVNLPVGATQVSSYIGPSMAGLVRVQGRRVSDPGNPTQATGRALEGNKKHEIVFDVRVVGDTASIDAQLNGENLFTWSGPQSDLSPNRNWNQPNRKAIGVGAGGELCRFDRIDVEAPGSTPSPTGDLLARIDPRQHSLAGDWEQTGDGLVLQDGNGRLALPARPLQSYEISVTYIRHDNGGTWFELPVGSRRVALVFRDAYAGLSGVRGMNYDNENNPTLFKELNLRNDIAYHVQARVELTAEGVRIKASHSGADSFALNWSGPLSDLQPWVDDQAPRDFDSLGLGNWNQRTTYKQIKLAVLRDHGNRYPDVSEPQSTESIDLLALYDPSRDRVAGEWSRTSGGVQSDDTNRARILLPAIPNGDYRLRVKLARKTRRESANIILPVGRKYCMFVFGGFADEGGISGFEQINRLQANENPTGKPFAIVRNEVYTLDLTVRGDAEKTLVASINGEPFTEWTGPRHLLSESNWNLPVPGAIGIGSWHGSWRFDEVSLTMLQGDAKHAHTGEALQGEKPSTQFDLLELAEPIRDATHGEWSNENGILSQRMVEHPEDQKPTLLLPARPDGSYELLTTFVRKTAGGGCAYMLPVGPTSLSLTVGGWDGTISGIGGINGLSYREGPAAKTMRQMETNRRYTLRVRVDVGNDEVRVSSQLDGVALVDWAGPIANIKPVHGHAASRLGIVAWNLELDHHRIELRTLSSNANLDRGIQPKQSIDLLAAVDPQQDNLDGPHWVRTDGALTGGNDNGRTRIRLPVQVDGDYRLTVKFKRTSGDHGLVATIPIGDTQAIVRLADYDSENNRELYSGLALVDLMAYRTAENPTRSGSFSIVNGREHLLEIIVRKKPDDTVSIAALTDGQQLLTWDGLASRLSVHEHWLVGNTHAIGIGITEGTRTSYQITAARLEMLQGEARLARSSLPHIQPTIPDVEKRLPVPSTASLQEARSAIREIFKDGFDQAQTPQQKIALAERLLSSANQEKDDVVGRYVLFCEARDLAMDVRHFPKAIEAVVAIGEYYDVDELELKVEILKGTRLPTHLAHENRLLMDASMNLMEECIANDRYQSALDMQNVAVAIAKRFRAVELVKQLADRAKEIRRLEREYSRVEQALEQLANEEHPDSSLIVGKYFGFEKDDWAQAFPYLAKGSDAKLAELAKAELGGPTEPADMVRIADDWFAFAATLHGTPKSSTLRRAGHWYLKAISRLTGLDKVRVEKRIKEIGPLNLVGRPEFLKEDLVLFLDFNTTDLFSQDGRVFAKDLSGAANHAHLSAADSTKRPTSGTLMGRFAELARTPGVGKGPFTISVWVYAEDIANGDSSFGRGVIRSTTGDQPGDWMLSVRHGGRIQFFHWRPGGTAIISRDQVVRENTWFHLAVTVDGTATRLYVNGQEIPHTSSNSGSGWGNGHEIGRIYPGETYSWNGKIDNVFLFKRSLSSQEISALTQIRPSER